MATRSNLIATYQNNPTLQSQYTQQQYLDLFDFGVQTPQPAPNPPPTRTPPPSGGVTNIIGQDLNQGGGGGGIPMVGSDGRIADFNEAITVRQNRLNDPGKIAQFAYDKGLPKQASYNEMLSRGMLGAKDTRLTSGIPFGVSGMIAKMMPDNYYDKMTLGDQILTQSYMGYTDPETGMANKDPFGINVRSGFGNYSEYADKTVDKLNEALVASAKKKGLSFDPVTGEVTGEQSAIDAWNELTKNLQTRRGYYTNVTNKKKDIAADLALIEKAKEEKAKQDAAALTTANLGIQNAGNQGGSSDKGAAAAGMGGGSQQATSAGSTKSGRKDGGWGWKDGGRVYLYNRLK
jgi:hypothetical protein